MQNALERKPSRERDSDRERERMTERGRQRGSYGNLCIIGTEIVNWQMPVEIFVHFVHFRLLRAAQHVDKKLHNYGCPDKRSDQLDRKCCLYTSRKRREAGKQASRQAEQQLHPCYQKSPH